MATKHLFQIASGVRDVMDAFARNQELCASFEVSGDPDRWVQFTAGVLNFAYPSDSDPTSLPSRLGPRAANALVLVEWKARAFATFNIQTPLTAQDVAAAIETVFESILGCAGGNYGIDTEVIEIEK